MFCCAVCPRVHWVRGNHYNQGIWAVVTGSCPGIPNYGLGPDVDVSGWRVVNRQSANEGKTQRMYNEQPLNVFKFNRASAPRCMAGNLRVFSGNTRLGVCCYHDYCDVTTLRPLCAGRMALWRFSCPQNLSAFGPSSHKEQALTSYLASASLVRSCMSYPLRNYLLVIWHEIILCIFISWKTFVLFSITG